MKTLLLERLSEDSIHPTHSCSGFVKMESGATPVLHLHLTRIENCQNCSTARDTICNSTRVRSSFASMDTDTLQARFDHAPVPLKFGTSGRRGLVIHLSQLEVYINALAELQYLQSL